MQSRDDEQAPKRLDDRTFWRSGAAPGAYVITNTFTFKQEQNMGSFSVWHWCIVLVIVMLVFGTKKLRNAGNDLGGTVRGFKEGMKDSNDANIGRP